MTDILKTILLQMDTTHNYTGFPPLVVTVSRYLEDPQRIFSVEKELYAPAAAQCGCPTSHVERNIRTIIQHAWKKNPRKVRELARCELSTYPTVSEFIELLALEAQKYLPPTA